MVELPIVRVQMVRESRRATRALHMKVRGPRDVYAIGQEVLGLADREYFVAVLLTAQHEVSGIYTVSIGTLDSSPVHPREVFKAAILNNAAAVILLHNHPSGDPAPSRADREVTDRLVSAGKIIGIPVLDHVVLGDGRYVSFAETGLMQVSHDN